jgi:polynucleotide 5'-hydroxyl-kinase GRC3/NOL9
MLSAVAARKAALAQSQGNENIGFPPTTAASLNKQKSPSKPAAPKPPSLPKRKSSASALPTATRAQKKQKAKKALHSNLNAATAVTSVEAALEVMNVDDLPGESSAPVNAIKFTGRRAWSPSRPLEDSSDEDDINPIVASTLYDPTEPALPPLEPDFSSSLPPTSLEALVLSTFTPIRDQNIFSLTLDEIDVLSGGSSSSQRTKAVAVILRPRDTLCLLGTYTLRVVRGAVSLDSTYLYPSPVFHQVFAPRSAPLPVIRHESLPATGPPANPNSIPRRVISQIGPDDVVLVLRELRTGVESLGNIQPRFSGVFRQKMRDGHADIHEIDLNGIHIVSVFSR